jgi:ketosteroid isomerase-like protein
VSENLELVHRLARLWTQKGPEAAAELFHPDFEMASHPDHPEPGVDRGAEAALGSILEWQEAFEDFEWEVLEATEVGDRVAVVVHERARLRGSSAVLDHAYGVLVTVRDGKIARAEWFADRDAAWAAAGALQEERPAG